MQRIRDAGAEIAYTEGVFPPLVSFARRVDDGAVLRDRLPVGGGRDRQPAGARLPGAELAIELYAIAGTPIYAPRLGVGLALTALIVVHQLPRHQAERRLPGRR